MFRPSQRLITKFAATFLVLAVLGMASSSAEEVVPRQLTNVPKVYIVGDIASADDKVTAQELQTLANLIVATVDPRVWMVNGGKAEARVFEMNAALVITCPQPTHEKISDFLQQLHEFNAAREAQPAEKMADDVKEQMRTSTRVYNVADLVKPKTQADGSTSPDFDPLVTQLKSSFAKAEADSITIKPFPTNLSLVVTCPALTHEKLADLLQSMRNPQPVEPHSVNE